LPIAFEDSGCYAPLTVISAGTVPESAQLSRKGVGSFSKELLANVVNVSTNRKEGLRYKGLSYIHSRSSKAFGKFVRLLVLSGYELISLKIELKQK
jgi:hypothetical protein